MATEPGAPGPSLSAAAPSGVDGVEARPGVPKPDPVLVVDGLRKTFDGITAVDVDHLEIPRGLITALIGPNGAGKTTLFNLLTGFEQLDAGTWSFDGRRLDGHAAHQIARLGMVRTFQLTKALRKMSVMDNMKLGAIGQRGENFFAALLPFLWSAQEQVIADRALALLERFNLHHMQDQYGGSLSGGQRKLLEMARALMAEPALVMLDEPMAGVNPALVESLLDHVRGLRAQGMSVVFVEHNMDVVMGISDWIVCLAGGRVIAEGTPESIADNEAVIDAYLGTRES